MVYNKVRFLNATYLNDTVQSRQSNACLKSSTVFLNHAGIHRDSSWNQYYSQNTRTFPLPVLKLVLYFSEA